MQRSQQSGTHSRGSSIWTKPMSRPEVTVRAYYLNASLKYSNKLLMFVCLFHLFESLIHIRFENDEIFQGTAVVEVTKSDYGDLQF